MKKAFSMMMAVAVLGAQLVGCGGGTTPAPATPATPATPAPGAAAPAETKLDYPKSPIEIVVPFGEGSASDIFVRKFAEIMGKSVPQPIQPVNKDGSGGLVGMLDAAQRKNDGYSLLSITPSHVIADVMGATDVKLLEDFVPVARIQSDVYVLAVTKNSQYNSFADLLASGKTVTVGGVSPGGLDDLTLSVLSKDTGLDIQYVPYKSGSEVKAAVLGGEVDIYLDKLVSAINYVKDGAVRPVLVLNDERIVTIPELADVPCTVELGYTTTIGSWRGFVVKKGTPQEIIDYLAEEMKKAYDTPEYQQFASDNLVDIRDGYLNAEDFAKDLQKEFEAFNTVATELGLK